MRHSLTPTAQDPDTNAFAGEPHFRGLSGGRKGAQDPWLSSPLCNVPLETSLEVAERHRQEAQRAAGLPGAAQRPGSHQPGTLWAKARVWSCRDTWGILVLGEVGLSVSLSY